MRRRIFRLSKELRFNCKAQETESSHWLRCLAGRKDGVAAVGSGDNKPWPAACLVRLLDGLQGPTGATLAGVT